MTKIERSALAVHGHFSQPPRGNPLDGTVGEEAAAAPYKNWNERITEKSYRPNAEIGNFKSISFSISEGLFKWLQQNAPETYKLITESDQPTVDNGAEAGNALATAYNHVILPLARKRDKRTQVIWGIAAFERHFGRKPLGFWLPELAVDTETLQVLAEFGIQYIILTGKQIRRLPPFGGAGPFRINLPGDKSIAVFARHDELSTDISFKVHNLGGAGRWSHQVLAPARRSSGPLLLLATAGETFGHHYAGEEQFLHWLVTHEAKQAGFEVTTLDHYFVNHPVTETVEIEERSTWGDQAGLIQWATGYVDQKQDTTWKGALRRALDNAASDVDRVFADLLVPLGVDPWETRNAYVPALFAGQTPQEFVAEKFPSMKPDQQAILKSLLHAERLTQRMYNSYTFTDNLLDGTQPRYAIACAAAALSLAQEATGHDLNDRLPSDLAVVTSSQSSVTGADMLRDAIREFNLTLLPQ